MSIIEFPYTLHKQYLMPIIPLLVENHKLWAFVDSGATFSIFSIDDARRIGLDWDKGRHQMIVVGDGSFIPTYFHDLTLQIAGNEIIAPIGFSERLRGWRSKVREEWILKRFGFEERTRGSHHVFRKEGIEEKINLQRDDDKAKPYQVRQVRALILKYKLGDKL